jgi:energy-coupling factor transport system ATP-binding protein
VSAVLGARGLATLERLSYWYPGSPAAALADVSLAIEPGLTAVVGPSGSGKSSLLRVLNGLVPHFHGGRIRGSAAVAGMDVFHTSTARLAREVGFVFQDPELQFVRSRVEDEVAFALENTAVPHPLIGPRVAAAMAAAGISGLAGRSVSTLSGGERQRVAIASALALGPRILVLDEPTSQLDAEGTDAVLATCAELAGRGTTVLLSEHRLGPLLPLVDRLAVMNAGSPEGPAPVSEVLDSLLDPPPLVELGRRLGWAPMPLTVEAARPFAPAPARSPVRHARVDSETAWELRTCAVGHGGIPTLADVDLVGSVGEVTVLMGPNGGGKTTLMRVIAGLHRPLSGTVWHRPGRVAYLPQDPGSLLHRRTIRAEVEYTLHRAQSDDPSSAILDRLGLGALAERYPGDLSSGQRQRAALAAILAGRPSMVLLDEPTRGMDTAARLALTALLRELTAGGASVVVSTHDSDLGAALADRVVIVGAGQVIDAGDPVTALSGDNPYATDIGRLYPGGPVTVGQVMQCL